MRFLRKNPICIFSAAALLLTAVLALTIYNCVFTAPLYWIYILSLNIVTFAFYGFDKLQSVSEGFRVPEAVLHMMALAGGFIGGFCGRRFFRHKTQKTMFMFILCLGAAVHAAYIIWRYLG